MFYIFKNSFVFSAWSLLQVIFLRFYLLDQDLHPPCVSGSKRAPAMRIRVKPDPEYGSNYSFNLNLSHGQWS